MKKDYEADGEFPSPLHGVNPDHEKHGSTRLKQDGQELEQRQGKKFYLGEDLRDHDATTAKGPSAFFVRLHQSVGGGEDRRRQRRALGRSSTPQH